MQTITLLILVDIIALPAYNNNRRQQCLKIVPAPRYAADKWSGSQILPLPGMRLINGWDKNVCRASSKDGALHLWEVFMLDAQLYFLSDQYYIDFPDDKLMQNKDMIDGIRRSRPCFLAFPDSKIRRSTGLSPFPPGMRSIKRSRNPKLKNMAAATRFALALSLAGMRPS